MDDLERIDTNTLDKFNQLKLSNHVCLDEDTKKVCFIGENVIPIVDKEFEAICNYYKRYRMYLLEGGSCISCKIQKMENVKRDYEEFLNKLKIKYFGGMGIGK